MEGEAPTCEVKLALSEVRAKFYRKVIERYREAVARGEQKTVPELKELINPLDEAVEKKRKSFLEAIGKQSDYDYPNDFFKYAFECCKYCFSLNCIESELSAPFWLSPSEIVELHSADEFDRALLLCSLLHAGGCDNAVVRALGLEGGVEHSVVVFSFDNKHYYCDSSQGDKIFELPEPMEEGFREFSYEGKKFVASKYEFNDESYQEFSGE